MREKRKKKNEERKNLTKFRILLTHTPRASDREIEGQILGGEITGRSLVLLPEDSGYEVPCSRETPTISGHRISSRRIPAD